MYNSSRWDGGQLFLSSGGQGKPRLLCMFGNAASDIPGVRRLISMVFITILNVFSFIYLNPVFELCQIDLPDIQNYKNGKSR